MTDVGVTAKTPFNDAVASEIRVRLALKRMSAAELARRLGVSQMYVWRRLEGQTAFDLNDLPKIAAILEVPVMDLFQRARVLNVTLSQVSRSAPADRTISRTVPHTTNGVSPSAPQRRDATRPQSAVPATSRRPNATRPPARPMAA